jgi:hypothetical protein
MLALRLRFYDVRDAAAYRETMVFEENGSAVDPIIESSEQLHNEWVEPGVPSPPADWSAAPAGVAHGRGLVAASGWWPGGPGWKKEDGIMSSIAEGDENSETLGLNMPELGIWEVKNYMNKKHVAEKMTRFCWPILPSPFKNFKIQYIGIVFLGWSELISTVKLF